jgi:hypothetical protein
MTVCPPRAVRRYPFPQIPAHTDGANGTGIGTQTPTPKPGVMSPFHAGGGGGGGGAGAATQVFVNGSNTVPQPHSAAWLTPGDAKTTPASGANAITTMLAVFRYFPTIAGSTRTDPPTLLNYIVRLDPGSPPLRIDDCVEVRDECCGVPFPTPRSPRPQARSCRPVVRRSVLLPRRRCATPAHPPSGCR